ncbi:MAG: hypothetical protein ACE5E8_06510, partial [Acidimicrobiia bacterium]
PSQSDTSPSTEIEADGASTDRRPMLGAVVLVVGSVVPSVVVEKDGASVVGGLVVVVSSELEHAPAIRASANTATSHRPVIFNGDLLDLTAGNGDGFPFQTARYDRRPIPVHGLRAVAGDRWVSLRRRL